MPHPHEPHDHDHQGTHAEINGAVPGYYEIMETAVRELLIEKRLIAPDEIRRQIEVLDSRTPALGAKVVARAWVDPAFRARLLADGRAACEEFGITFYDDTGLIVLENTDAVHNLIVCTLCSCYPRPVLGLPPDWYKLKPYRARAVVRATRRLGGVRNHHSRRRGGPRQRLHCHGSISCPAEAPGRHRTLLGGAIGRPRHPRRDDRRRTGHPEC